MIDYHEEEDEGCCLVCPEAEEGCLCYDCKCSKCDNYRREEDEEEGYCVLAEEWKDQSEADYERLRRNIQVACGNDGFVRVKVTGPVVKKNYARVKPFLQEHFTFNPQEKRYEVFTQNPRFVDRLFRILREADFVPELLRVS